MHAERQVRGLIRDLLAEAAGAGELRDDVAPDELASYCLHALTAARGLRSKGSRATAFRAPGALGPYGYEEYLPGSGVWI